MNPTHIKVTAPEGKTTPIGHADGHHPGGGLLHVVADRVYRVRCSQDIRRAINRGDLIACDMNGADVGVHLQDAAAPEELEGGFIDLGARRATLAKRFPLAAAIAAERPADHDAEPAPAEAPRPTKDETP